MSYLKSPWIEICSNEHASCSAAPTNPPFFPTTLIDVGATIDSPVTLINTCEVSGLLGKGSPYATLSHCWGKVNVIRTLKSNFAQHQRGIYLKNLPKTFQDAIRIVRALEVQYLWIDTLCIIQDDTDDWDKESVCMAGIYSNSYVNLAATGAPDSRSGCLIPRTVNVSVDKLVDTKSFLVHGSIHSSGPQTFIRPSFESIHHRYSTRNSLIRGLTDDKIAPLLTRAWVFQERQLAPRTVHFHSSEMIMECKSGLRCECTGLEERHKILTRKSFTPSKTVDHEELLLLWYEIVDEYSTR
ncbi:hypothetical protein BCON_0250g00020 [Botryotinia convoluta]|uniref:Heterokaryon incompatibility domain-containing protein n=1 Tax=Botryotinia convoluta TaxID=54673 RepID=A0A4Z1HGH7_9HELO|nr:hypothetical protein BCON_0250g00020 [Botryotinia convoluta]